MTFARKTAHGLLLLAALLMLATVPAWAQDHVTITDKGDYYEVIMDLNGGADLSQVAEEYVDKIKAMVPNLEQLADSYISDYLNEELGGGMIPVTFVYQQMLSRAQDFMDQLPGEYQETVRRAASRFQGGANNVLGDGLLSFDEAVMINLITDVARASACSSLSVWGARSATGNTITTRNLEWAPGNSNQLAQLHAVTTIKDGDKSICMVGFLGFMGALTVMNDDGILAGILDSGTGASYSSSGKRSYVFDLMYAMREFSTIEDIAAYMSDASHQYAFNHNIVLADGQRAAVLENNFSGSGGNMRRALRHADSTLQDGVSWGFDNALCVVNSFLLQGQSPNWTQTYNTARWEAYRSLLGGYAGPLGPDDLKTIATNCDGAPGGSDSIYQEIEMHIVVAQPGQRSWQIFFRPPDGPLPVNPTFQEVPIPF